ncbi:GntR family transcriptional regulator [Streptomyces daliensis]|uniref:GntR family transcriptional regulator n=1 Tax=Streptomyces daliensis TaxID=299421 RepID=A0A8T4ITM9_9ACTN|nr:GntR family transcriptional regulator [Streptomyces daliensis]
MAEAQSGREPAAERAYRYAKELILSGELAGGSLISEGEIAERVGLSRTPVREAFLRLEGEELLRLFPKKGAVVSPMPPGEAEDVLELREVLECTAVERIVRWEAAALDDFVARLRAAVRAQDAPAREMDLKAFVAADETFHRSLVTASGNALADRFYRSLGDRQRRMAALALRPRPERLPVLVREHGALADAVADRDPERFRAALRAHLDATHRALLGTA